MRTVIGDVYGNNPSTGKREWYQITGKFHMWGTDIVESNDGNVSYTVGIIETESGRVYNVHPEKIIFIDNIEE